MPSFASSPCTRGAPQSGLALLMFRISSRISGATPGRPGLRRRLFQVQYRLNPQRCQRMTVSGFTMTRTLSQSVQILRNSTQNPRSTFESRGRFTERRSTASCCRRATFSRASSRRARSPALAHGSLAQAPSAADARPSSVPLVSQHHALLEPAPTCVAFPAYSQSSVLPPSSVGEMTLRLYATLSYTQNSARYLRCALNGA